MTNIERKYRNYKIDYAHNILYFDYKFTKLAQIYGSSEYNLYRNLIADFPSFAIVVKSHRKTSANSKKRLTYADMECYMESFNESDILMEEFESIKKKYNGKYGYVLKWFYERFPYYGEVEARNYAITERHIGEGVYAVNFLPYPELTPENPKEEISVVVNEDGEVIS